MNNRKKKSENVAERNEKIAKLYDEGYTQQQIADKLGVTRGTVTKNLGGAKPKMFSLTEKTVQKIKDIAKASYMTESGVIETLVNAVDNINISVNWNNLAPKTVKYTSAAGTEIVAEYTPKNECSPEDPDSYIDEVGGYHSPCECYNPKGHFCGECSKESCKGCTFENYADEKPNEEGD